MPSLHPLPCCPRFVAVVLLSALVAGCGRPLALQHEYFSPTSGSIRKTSIEIRHTMSHYHALHAAQRACTNAAPAPASAEARPGPAPGYEAAHAAFADLCSTPLRPPVAAYGATSNAYRRWVEERVTELPAAGETAAAAGGGG